MRISNMSRFVLVRLFTVLMSDLMIVQSHTKWTTMEHNYTGTCATSYIPGNSVTHAMANFSKCSSGDLSSVFSDVCISNETNEQLISCLERKYMEVSKDSSVQGQGLSCEYPPYAASTDLFSALGYYKKDHRDVNEEYGHNYFQTCISPAIPAGIGSLSLGSLHSVHAQAETTSNSSVTGLIFAIGRLGANYSRRCVHYLVEAYKSPFGQTSSISLTGKEVKLTTVLWISGGVFMALILGLAICCTRGKCQKNTQERSPLSIPHSYPAFPVAETPPRPEARVRPFNNQGSVSSREESRPLLSPNNSPTSYSAVENPSGRSDHFVERLAGQNHSHPINVQGYNEYLRTAPTLDPNSITEDRSQWEDLEEIGDLNIPVDDQFQTGYSSLSNEQIDYATST